MAIVKVLAGFLFTMVVLGCGILELIFQPEYQQRYIEHSFEPSELVGNWRLTPESVTRIERGFENFKNGDKWIVPVPWVSFNLYDDSSCQIGEEIPKKAKDAAISTASIPICTWEITEVSGYDQGGVLKDVIGVYIHVLYYHNSTDQYPYTTDWIRVYIVEENNQLILWNYIDQPDYQLFEDFERTE